MHACKIIIIPVTSLGEIVPGISKSITATEPKLPSERVILVYFCPKEPDIGF